MSKLCKYSNILYKKQPTYRIATNTSAILIKATIHYQFVTNRFTIIHPHTQQLSIF